MKTLGDLVEDVIRKRNVEFQIDEYSIYSEISKYYYPDMLLLLTQSNLHSNKEEIYGYVDLIVVNVTNKEKYETYNILIFLKKFCILNVRNESIDAMLAGDYGIGAYLSKAKLYKIPIVPYSKIKKAIKTICSS